MMQTDPQEDYARGWVPFLDCRISLDSRPLIPRLETEYWVEKTIGMIRETRSGQLRCLDLFAGSGAIGVALLTHLPGCHVDFGEIDTAHLPTILKNIRENGVEESRTRIIATDVWSAITGTYDLVFANPPYLSENHRSRVQDSVLIHEPAVALFAGEDGLALIRRTIEGLREHTAPGGALFIEHDPEQSEAVSAIASQNGLAAEGHRDQFGVVRWSVVSVA